jgi:hypothetical protein
MMHRADGFRSPEDDVDLDDKSRGILERLQGHLELGASGGAGLTRRSMSALGVPSRLRFQDLRPFLQVDQEDHPDMRRLQLQLLDVIVPQFSLSDQAGYLLSCLSADARIDVIGRLVAYPAFEREHWINLFRPIRYSFGNSWLYRLVLFIAIYVSALAISELWYQVHQPHTGPGRLLPWWEIFVITLTWILVFSFGGASDPTALLVAALGPLLVPVIVSEEAGKRNARMYTVAWLMVPFLIGSMSVVIHATMTAHRLLGSWLLTAAMLMIVGTVVVVSCRVGSKRERRAINPLHGVLDRPRASLVSVAA